jgi:O-methyltransferase
MTEFYTNEGMYGQTIFSPWKGFGEFGRYYDQLVKDKTVVSPDRIWILYSTLKQCLNLKGEVWECGVYKGGTSLLIARTMNETANRPKFRLFDTFEGMPECDKTKDAHNKGDFKDTSYQSVSKMLEPYNYFTDINKGFIPDTFLGLEESSISFAHVDVDIYKSVYDCCEFIYPRMKVGGVMIFDDYGFTTTKGCREAVDKYFRDYIIEPIVLPTGQAMIIKMK